MNSLGERVVQYKIVKEYGVKELVKSVNDMLKLGWELHSGPFTGTEYYQVDSQTNTKWTVYCQAIVMIER